MKIRTTRQIIEESELLYDELINDAKFHSDYYTEDDERQIESCINNKRWVSVKDVIDYLKKMDSERYIDELIIKLEKK